MVYDTLTITFRNRGSITFSDGWTDYDYVKGFIVVKNVDVWVAMYNAEEVFSVVLGGTSQEKSS
jgi:hypothetical protein